MSKKIHELAKELNVTSKRLMEKLEEISVHPKSHMSTLEDDELNKLYKHIGIVRHDDEKGSIHPDSEAKHDTHDAAARKNAPRIIRKTEVIVRDTTPEQQTDRKKPPQDNRRGLVRNSERNDGLLGGYVRGSEQAAASRKAKPADQSAETVAPEQKDSQETIRLVERHQKPVDDILSVKKVVRVEREEPIEVKSEPRLDEAVQHMGQQGKQNADDAIEKPVAVQKPQTTEEKPVKTTSEEPAKAETVDVKTPVRPQYDKRPQEPVRTQEPVRAQAATPPVRPQDAYRPQYDPNRVRPQDNRPQGERPQGERPQGDRPPYDPNRPRPQYDRPQGDRPQGDRPQGDRPQGDRPPYDPNRPRPQYDRPQGDRPPYDPNRPRPQYDRPQGDRPQGDRPPYDPNRPRPQYDRPQGDRPQGDRPPYDPNRPRPQYDRPQGDRPQGDRPPFDPNRPRPQYGPRPGDGPRPPFDPNRPRPTGGFGGPRRDDGFRPPMDKDADLRGPQRGGPPRGAKPVPGAKTDKPIEEKAAVRGERRTFSTVDKQKDDKKDVRPPVRTTPVAKDSGKLKKKIDIVGQKSNVSDMMNDEFVIDAFYNDNDDAMNAKRAEKRLKRARVERQKHIPPKAVLTEITVGESTTVKDLAESLKKTAADVIKRLFMMGITATQNQELDFETASILADEYKVAVKKAVVVSAEDILFDDSDDKSEELLPRAPVVVVMGHVDHGKTSLLDAIRSENIAESEAGGITQHIGAYTVHIHGRDITFLDTPGHEAFTAMRKRGAQATDIAILVVAADDGVMPQTIEAIHHARAANVSIIIAINKIDKPNANMDRVKQELSQHGIVIEEWGGDVPCVPVSAKQRLNIDNLLEMVLLTADVLELKADVNKQAKGMVIEARLDKNKGPIATLLVQRGTLKVGDVIISGSSVGRIRAMTNDKGRRIKEAGPSIPVEITGMQDVPDAGELFYAVEDERVARQLAEKRYQEMHESRIGGNKRITLDDLYSQIQSGNVKDLNLIIKADVQGSVEAIKASLLKLSNEEVKVKIVHDAVGAITESDVSLADVSNAIIIGFNVRPANNVQAMVEASEVDMRLYRVIYDAINDIEKALKGMLAPTFKEVIDGHIEIRQLFKVSNVGTIAGSYVLDGKVGRNAEVRLVRSGIVVYEGKLASLKRFKDDAKEVLAGFECGVMLEKFNDIREGDIVEAFHQEQVVV